MEWPRCYTFCICQIWTRVWLLGIPKGQKSVLKRPLGKRRRDWIIYDTGTEGTYMRKIWGLFLAVGGALVQVCWYGGNYFERDRVPDIDLQRLKKIINSLRELNCCCCTNPGRRKISEKPNKRQQNRNNRQKQCQCCIQTQLWMT